MARNPIRRLTNTAYSTTRPTGTGGQTGAPAAHLSGLLGTEAEPISADTAQRLQLQSAYDLLEVYFNGALDISKADFLVGPTKTRRVKHVELFSGFNMAVTHVVVEDT